MTQQQLEKYLWGAATQLRGTIDAGDYKQYIFPLLFFKRICDVYDEEYESALAESEGDIEYATFAENHHFQVPAGAHWNDVRSTTTNVGMALQEAMRAIEKANPDTLYGIFGAQTTKLIHENIHVGAVHQLEEFILDADVIEDIFNNPDPKNTKKLEKILIARFKKYGGNAVFKKLSERLEALRDKAEQGLITSIEFVKELCKIAKETVQAEKEAEQARQEKTPVAALTELFLELKTDQTPAVVERIVADIDAIVRVVSFQGWQNTVSGEREVQKALRQKLLKYQLHKDQVLFDRAYGYIKEYY